MKTSKAQLRAVDRYDKENTVQVKLKLNIKTDSDILEKLDSEPNKQGYIKELIRADITHNILHNINDRAIKRFVDGLNELDLPKKRGD